MNSWFRSRTISYETVVARLRVRRLSLGGTTSLACTIIFHSTTPFLLKPCPLRSVSQLRPLHEPLVHRAAYARSNIGLNVYLQIFEARQDQFTTSHRFFTIS